MTSGPSRAPRSVSFTNGCHERSQVRRALDHFYLLENEPLDSRKKKPRLAVGAKGVTDNDARGN